MLPGLRLLCCLLLSLLPRGKGSPTCRRDCCGAAEAAEGAARRPQGAGHRVWQTASPHRAPGLFLSSVPVQLCWGIACLAPPGLLSEDL